MWWYSLFFCKWWEDHHCPRSCWRRIPADQMSIVINPQSCFAVLSYLREEYQCASWESGNCCRQVLYYSIADNNPSTLYLNSLSKFPSGSFWLGANSSLFVPHANCTEPSTSQCKEGCAHGVIVTPGIGCVRLWWVVILCWPTKARCEWCRCAWYGGADWYVGESGQNHCADGFHITACPLVLPVPSHEILYKACYSDLRVDSHLCYGADATVFCQT